jgi:DNA-binding transcriptional ArsR family regulator
MTGKSGQFSYDGLDRIMHEKARLGIMTSLLTEPNGRTFSELKELCSLTDGNLSRHISALEEAGLLTVKKSFEKNKPKTLCRLSSDGRKKFLDYIGELERVISDAGRAGRASEARERHAGRHAAVSPKLATS